ncbi:hypothetical protein AAU61_04965 [Desulfocarbo indianensis]|nr:hypothetical protein AAU61_04965 [Desulfocarbo indianensis]
MFSRLFACDPQKLMRDHLREVCPDPALWKEVCAYLSRGRRPKSRQAMAAITAYLDLRETLGGLAAFRAAGQLTHQALEEPCRQFASAYETPAGLEPAAALAWARFLLAADHLLAMAYEASLSPGISRGQLAQRIDAMFAETQQAYLLPLGRELGKERTPPKEARAGALSAEAAAA